ncbi:flagellar hook-basal body complex protein FliE [Alkalibacter mobilis]|uniref:flagellar hook-basal body complex protein FliE n=1 Tax=Alkalibacter mobilis TaxID=2787712 RepID=UPI00189E31F7|nr:flagellar hook-basal body complex protein FliE [Alkalibacter mobilis]MBF7096325.1 flagellar hook-basal body complex protein FliE [Alkalibacter mobilis]
MNGINSEYNNILSRYKNLVNQSIEIKPEELESLGQPAGSFESLISEQIGKLNSVQTRSDDMIADFAAGNTEDLHQVMITAEEARLSMELAVQIRNKVVEAYKELNNMQL